MKSTVPSILSCELKTCKYYNRNRFIVSSAKVYNQGATRLDPHGNLISKCRNLLNSIGIANLNMYFEKPTLVLIRWCQSSTTWVRVSIILKNHLWKLCNK
ncbi:hypothetical protein SLEP1_g60241 [Rubroshorea leprosula]|uniref:Uncharacterized protein n=1 Tax=Rubroshorea leprosula TaxID=152421 RepID=A0AAV5MVZ9_9ROSI|nr:hypothetical protein SLEP1_g60241 [Rubroshorea leprosula]